MRYLRAARDFPDETDAYGESGAEAIEIALDDFPDVPPGKLRLLADRSGLRAIASTRDPGGEGARLLERAVLARFDFIDVGLEMDVERRARVLALARKYGARTVVTHRSGGPPRSLGGVLRLVQKCARAGGDLVRVDFPLRRAQEVRMLRDAGDAQRGSPVSLSVGARGPLGPLASLLSGELACGRMPGRPGEGPDIGTLSRLGARTRLLGIVGEPAHPLSERLFNEAFSETGQDCACVQILPEANDRGETLALMKEMGFSGVVAGSPFRGTLPALLGRIGSGSRAGSADAAILKNGVFAGEDACGPALLATLSSNGVKLGRRRAVVLGAGGAARSVARALSSKGVPVVLVARNLRRALAAVPGSGATAAMADSLPALLGEASLLVSCVPSGAERMVPPSSLRSETVVVDCACTGSRTRLIEGALDAGALGISGVSLWLHHCAEVLRLFTGRRMRSSSLEGILRRISR